VTLKANSQKRTILNPYIEIDTFVIKPRLGIPFGTIAKLEVQFFSGDDLHLKYYTGMTLLKVNSVNGKTTKDTVTMTFTDETRSLEASGGQKLTIMAYETGSFTGIPDNYFDYQPVRQDQGFGFQHNLIVVSNLTNKSNK
jgi:hypothetical protein